VRLAFKRKRNLLLAAFALLLLAAWFVMPGLFYANACASNDVAVLRVALEHFAKHERYLARHKEARTLIVVNDQTEGAYPFDWPIGQPMGHLSLSANYWNLKDRNGIRASLRGRSLGQEFAVADLSTFPMYFGEFEMEVEKRFPGTTQACYVQLWLPGYSLGGTIALVEFRFGPSSHGAQASYFLKKQGDAWVVSDYDLAYFL
jgi:hypothetical protein